MRFLQKLAIVSGIGAAAVLIGSGSAQALNGSLRAKAILDTTKTTRSTYSIYIWNTVTNPEKIPFKEASAEYHSGDLHRVETPRDRIIANCREKTGAYLAVTSGKLIEGPSVAAAACGINTNFPILAMASLGEVKTKFGKAQRISVTDAQTVREYDVSPEGILLKSIYRENRVGGAILIVSEVVRLERQVPDQAMFVQTSLSRRYLPLNLKYSSVLVRSPRTRND